jgi:NADH-quinone oxidoreductase subunit M
MLKMFQHAMLGETNTKSFADVTVNEGITFGTYNWCFVLFWDVSKNQILITPSLEEILKSDP